MGKTDSSPRRRQRHEPVESIIDGLSEAQQRTARFSVREARTLVDARREFSLTGAQALSSVLRTVVRGTYSFTTSSLSPHVRLVASRIDEPSDEPP